ncbi:MAG TPA: hypothetical protein VGP46_14595 [Acidimicrobiales bacterium]|jgi:hypothetical protein|nr:hypothetical protein [Acidimicrobiales bacterium]
MTGRRRCSRAPALVAVALSLAACTAASASGHGGHPTTSTTPGSSAPTSTRAPTTTTTTLPASFGIGLLIEKWVEHSVDEKAVATDCGGGVIEPGRRLLTDVFYPSAAPSTSPVLDAARATAGAPYPVIVFAHGYDQLPSYYQALLDAWVKAGFVVVAPVFPCENAAYIAAIGGYVVADKENLEADDLANEAGDVAFVVSQLAAAAASPASFLHPVLDMSKLALAGQSDGATAVGALVYYLRDRSEYDNLPVKPLAVALLSGARYAAGYRPPPEPPAELSSESTADECNPQEFATLLYDVIHGDNWFLTIDGATHLAPYTGVGQWASATEGATTAWLELELGWRSASAAASELATDGNMNGVTSLSHVQVAPPLADVLPLADYGSAAACGLQ